MKKRSGISLMLLVVGALFLTGCGKTETPQGSEQQTTKVSSAKAILETLAPKIGKSVNDIQAQNVSLETSEEELAGYRLVNDAIPPQSEIGPVIENFFEGWVSAFEADGVGGSLETYLNDDLFCNVSYELNYNLSEVLERLYSGDPEQEAAANEEMDKIFAEATTTVSIECAEFTEKVPSPLEFTFNLFGEEPFWNAELRLNNLNYTIPNDEIQDFVEKNAYIQHFEKSGENLAFSGPIYEPENQKEFKGELTKANCIDGGKGDTHEYQVKLTIGDQIFEGCADKVDNFLVNGREGKLENLLKTINYKEYSGTMNPKTASYGGIETDGNLVEIFLTQEGSEKTEYLVLGSTDEGWETYWQGEYPVDDDTCEKFVEVPRLMDFGIFSSCPRG